MSVRLVSLVFIFFFQAAVLVAAADTNAKKPSAHGSEQRKATPAKRPQDALDILSANGLAYLEEGAVINLRDGTHLMATLVVPNEASASSKRPAILIQSPYPATFELRSSHAVLSQLIRKGYVIVVANDRGTQWSEGEYHWLKGAAADGVDAIKWITRQPWSNGAVGAWGCSSSGEVTLPLAKANPPGLKAVVAMGAATGVGNIPDFADQGVFYTGGVPLFAWAWWYHGDGYWHHPKLPSGLSQAERVALIHAFNPTTFAGTSQDLSWATHLPSQDLLTAIGSPETEFNTLIRMHPNDPKWGSYDFLRTGDRTSIPILHIDNWYDSIEVYGTTKVYQYLASHSPNQYMIVGPGPHCTFGNETKHTMVGARPVGDARFDYAGTIVKWFDHWMSGPGEGDWNLPHVQYYPLESNHWVSTDAWPPPATPRRFYLVSGGHANSVAGDGRLADEPRSGDPDRFRDDPLNPVPSHGGGCCDPAAALDQSEIERRQDVLVYSSLPFAKPLDIVGYLSATLYFSTSVPDTDIALKVVDVYPNGKAYNVIDTIQRLRYRDGIESEKLMSQGSVYKLTLRQMVTASKLGVGHRLRIEIAGTNFPQYERNMHSGGKNYDESVPAVAEDVIYHDPGHASFLEVPVAR